MEVPWLHFLRGQDVLSWALCCKKHLATVKPKAKSGQQARFSLPHLKLDGVHGTISYTNILPLVDNVAHLHVRQMPPSIWKKLAAESWSKKLTSLKVEACNLRLLEEELDAFMCLCQNVRDLSMLWCRVDVKVVDAMVQNLKVETFTNYGTGVCLFVKCDRFVGDANDDWMVSDVLLAEGVPVRLVDSTACRMWNRPDMDSFHTTIATKNLLHLDFNATSTSFLGSITPYACPGIATAIKNGLLSLRIIRHDLDDSGFGTILSALANSRLEILDLSDNCISGCEVPISNNKPWTSLRELRICGHNSEQPGPLSTLRWMTKLPPNLEIVSFAGSHLTSESLTHFASLMEAAAAKKDADVPLWSIDFSQNLIDDSGFDAFCSLLMFCPYLAKINFSCNDISEPEVFIDMLPKCFSLKYLNLSGNGLRKNDLHEILSAVQQLYENVDEVYRHKIQLDLRHNIHDISEITERQQHKSYHLIQLDNVYDEMTRIAPESGYNHHDVALDCFVYLEAIGNIESSSAAVTAAVDDHDAVEEVSDALVSKSAAEGETAEESKEEDTGDKYDFHPPDRIDTGASPEESLFTVTDGDAEAASTTDKNVLLEQFKLLNQSDNSNMQEKDQLQKLVKEDWAGKGADVQAFGAGGGAPSYSEYQECIDTLKWLEAELAKKTGQQEQNID